VPGFASPFSKACYIPEGEKKTMDFEKRRLYPFLDIFPAGWIIQEMKGHSHEKV